MRFVSMNKLLLAALALSSATACSTDTGSMAIADSQLAGTVAGQSWSFQAGATNAFLSEGEDNFFAALYPSTFTACGFSEPSGPHLIVAIPKVAGDYDLDLHRNMTFVTQDNRNLVSLDGRIVVDEVTATHVVGGLHGVYDGDNEVNGRFDVTICAR
jgi:hypothetical protein